MNLFIFCLFLGLAKTQVYPPSREGRGLCDIVVNGTCPNRNVTFFIFTRLNVDAEQVWVGKNLDNSNLEETNFNPSHPTKVLIHGYNSDMSMTLQIKDAYLFRGEYNVFLINWSELARGPCYPAAVYNAELVGKCVAELIKKLRRYQAEIHLIGFSLGAHVAGFAGGLIGKESSLKVSRITGLDPALPGFLGRGAEQKLDPQDAEFVDVIHTNAFIQGIVQESGHIDFYANGGFSQPGCWPSSNPLACSHHRAIDYFTESINSKVGFWGWSCSSYFEYILGRCIAHKPTTLMGEDVDQSERGTYIFITNSEEPFAIGRYFVDFFDEDVQLLLRK